LPIIILILFGLFVTISLISNTFDGDFGWHLRFGQDAWQNNFQYTDSYTWAHYGKEWFNHEWGGDMVFWFLYDKIGYFSLVIFVSLSLWLTFLLSVKIFNKKLTVGAILISILSLISLKFVLMMRLSMVAPLFFVLLWWSLEKLPHKKTYYWWPVILWLWSFFHGSWILGFILINIYLVGNLIQIIITKKNFCILRQIPRLRCATLGMTGKNTNWTLKTIKNTILWQIISALVIMINPYGWKMWGEIILYFTNGYYKSWINEWLPSYTYPIYWWPIVIAAIAMVVLCIGWKKKQVTWAQLLLFIAFFISAMQYKRNNFYLVLICLPLLVIVWKDMSEKIKIKNNIKKIFLPILISTACIIYAIWFLPRLRFTNNVWQDKFLLARYNFPLGAIKFLQKETKNKSNIRLFNAYGWGGFLNWTVPNTLVYLDGRSAATWLADDGEPLLKKHIEMLTEDNKLPELEKNNVKYVILRKNIPSYPKPNWINRIIFDKKDLERVMSTDPFPLEVDLDKSDNWELIYSDVISKVWRRISHNT